MSDLVAVAAVTSAAIPFASYGGRETAWLSSAIHLAYALPLAAWVSTRGAIPLYTVSID